MQLQTFVLALSVQCSTTATPTEDLRHHVKFYTLGVLEILGEYNYYYYTTVKANTSAIAFFGSRSIGIVVISQIT